MSELEDIKARAAERRKYHPGPSFGFPAHDQAEADLDHALAIADRLQEKESHRIGPDGHCRCAVLEEHFRRELDEAIAAVLQLRSLIAGLGGLVERLVLQGEDLRTSDWENLEAWRKVASDTEPFERFRQPQDRERRTIKASANPPDSFTVRAGAASRSWPHRPPGGQMIDIVNLLRRCQRARRDYHEMAVRSCRKDGYTPACDTPEGCDTQKLLREIEEAIAVLWGAER